MDDAKQLEAFEAKIASGAKIEPKDWMPEAYRKQLIRMMSQSPPREVPIKLQRRKTSPARQRVMRIEQHNNIMRHGNKRPVEISEENAQIKSPNKQINE